MAKYKEHIKNECRECQELIATTVNEINSECLKNPESCCFGTDYGMSFPSDACEFARAYKTILFSINTKDYEESLQSRITLNSCVENNIEALELCHNKGKCAEIPPNPNTDFNSASEWCNKTFPINKNQVSCWECVAENSPCEWTELDRICIDLKNCRDNSLLDIIDPPSGKLLDCLEKFARGTCCRESRPKSTKGMSKRQKQFFWEQRMGER